MANEFSQGLMVGFNFVDAIRQRRRRNELDAERLSITQAASRRADRGLEIQEEGASLRRDAFDRQTKVADDAENRRLELVEGREAAFRVDAATAAGKDPDPEDVLAMQRSAGLGDQISADKLDEISNQSGIARTLTELSAQPQQTIGSVTAAPATQSPSGEAGPSPLAVPLAAKGALSPEGNEQLEPDQFEDAGTRSVPVFELMPFMPEEERAALGQSTAPGEFGVPPLLQAGQPPPDLAGQNASRDMPVEFLFEREINALPIYAQKAARERNFTILGAGKENAQIRAEALADERSAQIEQWSGVLDVTQESALRDMAADFPNQYLNKYADIRQSLPEDNTRVQLDHRALEVVDTAIPKLRQAIEDNVPKVNGIPDFTTDEGKVALRTLDNNVALRRAIQNNFSIAQEAGIRGSTMPFGNPDLVESVGAAIKQLGIAAQPPSPHERTVNDTILRQASQNPSRQATTQQIDAVAFQISHGNLDFEQGLNWLKTGVFDPAALEMFSHDPTKDLYRNGALVQPARVVADPTDFAEFANDRYDKDLEMMQGMYPEDKYGPARATEMLGSFMRWKQSRRDDLLNTNAIDVLQADDLQNATFFQMWADETKLRNSYESAIWPFGIGDKDFDELDAEGRRQAAIDEGIPQTRAPQGRVDPNQISILRQGLRQLEAEGDPEAAGLFAMGDKALLEELNRLNQARQ